MVYLRSLIPMTEQERQAFRKTIIQEAKDNVVLLPTFLEVAAVSEDNEIEFTFEGEEDDE